ncbi:MAG: hypothetical protein NVSMB16_01880 [Acidimicrobiales bacterium]
MALAVFQFRASFAARWRSYLGIAVLLGLLGGVGMFSIAGARRTQSTYPRFVRAAAASTLAVDAGPYDAKRDATVAAFPQVTRSRTYVAFNVAPIQDGRPDTNAQFEAVGSLDGRFFDQDRFTPTKGRWPDPTRADEVAVNEFTAKQMGYHVGQRIDLGTYSDEQVRDPDFDKHPSPPKLEIPSTVVGIGVFVEEVLQDESDRSQILLLTPAYTARALPWATYEWQGLMLRRGDADVEAVKKQFIALIGPGSPQFFRVTSVDTFHAQRATRPLSIALGLFGGIALLAALVLVGQALGRLIRSDREERSLLRALGARPASIALASLLGSVLAVVAGTALALVIAVVASAATPVGRVRKVGLSSGVHVDLTVLASGAAVLIVTLVALSALTAWREGARLGPRAERPSVIVGAASARGMSPVAVAGLRLAFEPGSGRTAVPTRSVMAGATIAITALVASLTFGSSLQSLVAHHRLYGWNWDATYEDRSGYGNARLDGAHAVLDNKPDVESWSGAFFGSDLINGQNVPLLGMVPGSLVLPPLVRGRAAANPGEVVLGAATASRLGKTIGDVVAIGASAPLHDLRVVGIATLPTIGIVHGAHTSLGVGALVAPELVPGFDRNITESTPGGPPPTRVGPNAIFIRYRPGVDPKTAFTRLSRSINPIASFPGTASLIAAQRPAEIVNTSEVGRSPALLAGALALGAVASLGLALATSVRRRRRDLALLKALGFTRRQVGATVAWQATATIAVGLILGLPVGVALGRGLWSLFAGQLDVLPRPSVPVLVLLVLMAAAIFIANLIAALPARIARRVRPSLVLRSE